MKNTHMMPSGKMMSDAEMKKKGARRMLGKKTVPYESEMKAAVKKATA